MDKPELKIEWLPIASIKPYPKNAKLHPKKQILKIADSIKELGWMKPISVDPEGVIIYGHGTYLAAESLKLQTVPVLTLNISKEKAAAYRLADNQLSALTGVMMDIVIEELKGMSLPMVSLTGFDVNLILETKEDKPDLSAVGKPKSVLGDIYQLGEHKLICGDATKPEAYEKLLGLEKARLIFTDPPYSVDYHSVAKFIPGKEGASYHSERFGGTGGRIFNDDKTSEEALLFYTEALKQLYNFSTEDCSIYWWYASRLADINMQAFKNSQWHYSQSVIWLKNSIVLSMGQLYHRIYEPCMVGWKLGKTKYYNSAFANYSELWTTDHKTFAEHLDAWYEKRDATAKYIHPTQKPVRLSERAIKRSSEKGDIVLDAFGGSGSTMIACEQLERKARLIELDAKFVDATIKRWCQYKDNWSVIKNGEEILWKV